MKNYLIPFFTLIVFVFAESCTKSEDNEPNPDNPPVTNPPPSPPSAPIDSAVTIYTTTYDTLYAFNATNGSKKWGIPIVANYKPVTYADGMLYLPLLKFYAIDTTGKIKWTTTLEASASSKHAIVSGGLVYINDEKGNIYAIETSSGNVKWQVKAASFVYGNLVLKDGVIYNGGSYLDAYDAMTGQRKWSVSTMGVIQPVVYANKLYVTGIDDQYRNHYLKVYDRGTGAFIKQIVVEKPLAMNAARGKIFLLHANTTGNPQNLSAVDTATLSIQWRSDNFTNPVFYHPMEVPGAYPVIVDSFLLINSTVGSSLYNLHTGKIVLQRQGYGYGSTYVNNMVFSFDDFIFQNEPANAIVGIDRSTNVIKWRSINLKGERSSDLCVVTKSGRMYRNGTVDY